MTVNIVNRLDDLVQVRHVLISVSDKGGLDSLVRGLLERCPEVVILSTGGTYARIAEILGEELAACHLKKVSDYTGQPETQGGLVKTLDFKIYLGLLTERYNEAHQGDLERTGAVPIDLVVVNLYPFKETVAKEGVTVEQGRANVDIGGPCMLRASAKNYLRVSVVVDPGDYDRLLQELGENSGALSLNTRFELARKAFSHTADYDGAISRYLAEVDFGRERKCYEVK